MTCMCAVKAKSKDRFLAQSVRVITGRKIRKYPTDFLRDCQCPASFARWRRVSIYFLGAHTTAKQTTASSSAPNQRQQPASIASARSCYTTMMKHTNRRWTLLTSSIAAISLVGGISILHHNGTHNLLLPLFMLPVLAMVHWVALQLYRHN